MTRKRKDFPGRGERGRERQNRKGFLFCVKRKIRKKKKGRKRRGMATRDRTAVYKRLRDEYIIHPPSRGGGRFMDGLETKIKEGGKRMRGKKKKGGYDELGGKKRFVKTNKQTFLSYLPLIPSFPFLFPLALMQQTMSFLALVRRWLR